MTITLQITQILCYCGCVTGTEVKNKPITSVDNSKCNTLPLAARDFYMVREHAGI